MQIMQPEATHDIVAPHSIKFEVNQAQRIASSVF